MLNIVENESESSRYKIFVGNVPYNCSLEEFEECFKKIKGYKKAEIIRKPNKNISRGFGFVTLNNQESLNELKDRTDIKCRDRYLRLSKYDDIKKPGRDINNINNMDDQNILFKVKIIDDIENALCFENNKYIYIENIPLEKDREWLKKKINKYGPFGKYFIITNNNENNNTQNGIIEILDDDKYEKILEIKQIEVEIEEENENDKKIILKISKYKYKNKYNIK